MAIQAEVNVIFQVEEPQTTHTHMFSLIALEVAGKPRFPVPDRSTRAKLWDASLPKLAPRAADVDVMSLASDG